MISGKTLVAVGVGIGAVVAAPYTTAAAGFTGAGVATGTFFTGAGVATGTLAAWLQGSATAAGSWFALGQSAGAAGLATGTQASLFGSISSATRYVAELFSECEDE